MSNHEKGGHASPAPVSKAPGAASEIQQDADEGKLLDELQEYRLELDTQRSRLNEVQNRLEEASGLIFSVLDNAAEGIMITNPHGLIQSVNPAFERTTGYTAKEAINHTPALLKSGKHGKDFYYEMWLTLKEFGQWHGEIWNKRKNGEIYPEWLSISAVKDRQQKVVNYVGIFSDVHTQAYTMERLRYLAYYDGLTGLPNRQLFMDRLVLALSQAQRDKHMLAVMFIDIDQFKQVNDTCGHKVGDRLLIAMTERMKGCLRDGDTLARIGGDEFTVILPYIAHHEAASHVAEKFLACYALPLNIEGNDLQVSASIGIGIFPDDGENTETLLHHADVAMYRIKETGRNGYLRYSPELAETTPPADA